MLATQSSRFTSGVLLRIVRIHQHFPARSAEWGLAFILLSWGLATLTLPTNFEQVLRVHGNWPVSTVWGVVAVVTGVIRVTALYINGSSQHSPAARMVCAAISGSIWVHLVALFITAAFSMPLFPIVLVVVPWFVIGDFYASYEAGKDAKVASEVKKALRDGVTSNSSDGPERSQPIQHN